MESACGSKSKPYYTRFFVTDPRFANRKKKPVMRNNTPIIVTNLDETVATAVNPLVQVLLAAVKLTSKATASSVAAKP